MGEFIVFSWFLTLGFVPIQYDQVNKERLNISNSTVAELGLTATAFNKLEIYTSIENFQIKSDNTLYFNPYRVDYTTGLKYKVITGVTLEAKHYCNHMIYTNLFTDDLYVGGETQITITFSGSTR